MDLSDPLRRALERLDVAVRALEGAAERRAAADAARADAGAAQLVFRDEHARLAAELDAALARNAALERVTDEVAARVERAGEAVRSALAGLAASSGPA